MAELESNPDWNDLRVFADGSSPYCPVCVVPTDDPLLNLEVRTKIIPHLTCSASYALLSVWLG